MAKQNIKIINCSDTMRWYANHVGETFPVLGESKDDVLTREPSGYTNVVLKEDCELLGSDRDTGGVQS